MIRSLVAIVILLLGRTEPGLTQGISWDDAFARGLPDNPWAHRPVDKKCELPDSIYVGGEELVKLRDSADVVMYARGNPVQVHAVGASCFGEGAIASLHELLIELNGRYLIHPGNAGKAYAIPGVLVKSGTKYLPAAWRGHITTMADVSKRIVSNRAISIRSIQREFRTTASIATMIYEHQVAIGMTESMVLKAIGNPGRTAETITRYGNMTEWFYGLTGYVAFIGGRVTAARFVE